MEESSKFQTAAGKKANQLLDDFEKKQKGTSAFKKSRAERTENEHLAISLRCDPDAAFVTKARSPEQLERMATVQRLEKAMQNSKKFGGDPNKTKNEICRIYGLNPDKVDCYDCTDADDIRLAALVLVLESIREKVSALDLDDLFDEIIQIVKRRKA